MRNTWIFENIQQMKNSLDSNLRDLGRKIEANLDKFEKYVSTVNKNTGEIVLIKLDDFQ